MKKMSKLLAVMLVLVMVLAMFAGCENTDKPATEPPKPDTTAGNEPVKTDAPVTDAPPATDAPKPAVTNQIIYGTTTELSGDLGNAWWTNNAADKTLRDLIDDYDVVVTNQSGEFVYNDTVVKEVKSEENEDGTKTYTVTINEGLKYNNGDPITAADFVAYELVALSPATKEDGAKTTAEIIVGGTEYQNGEAKFISGLRLLDEYTYAITISKDYLPYYFDMTYASLRPIALKQYASAPLVVKDDGEGAYLDGGELKKEEIDAARWIYTDRISAGPYVLAEFDQASLTATLKINPNYNGKKS